MAFASPTPTVLVAHRGLSDAAQVKYQIPEHSIKAYNWAIAQGAQVIDFDLQYTKDDKLVDIHNQDLTENTNGSGLVKNKTLSDIKKLWLELPQDRDGNGNDDNTDQHPVSGNEALNILVAHPGLMATVETKYTWSQTRMNRLRDVIKDKGLMNRVIIHSFNLDHVKYAKTAGFPLRGYVVNSDVATLPSAAYVKTYANYVFVPLARLTAAKAGEYQAAGLKVAVWTLDNTTEYDQALAKKADIWICNDIKEAKEYLEQAA